MPATAARPVSVELVARETSPRVGGRLLLGGKPYRYFSERGGYAVENADSGAIYHVHVHGGKVTGCDCPDRKYRGGTCRHMTGAEAALAAW